MKKIYFSGLLIVGFSLGILASTVSAAPGSGWSVYGGFASHTTNGEITEGILDGATFSIASSGLSIGGDYQFGLTDNFSLNIIFMSSSESASSDELLLDSAGHGLIGLQGRIWSDEVFVGGHIGSYSEVIADSASGTSASQTGTGFGAIVGWENSDGLFISGQIDQANLIASDSASSLSGVRLHVGYRWK